MNTLFTRNARRRFRRSSVSTTLLCLASSRPIKRKAAFSNSCHFIPNNFCWSTEPNASWARGNTENTEKAIWKIKRICSRCGLSRRNRATDGSTTRGSSTLRIQVCPRHQCWEMTEISRLATSCLKSNYLSIKTTKQFSDQDRRHSNTLTMTIWLVTIRATTQSKTSQMLIRMLRSR